MFEQFLRWLIDLLYLEVQAWKPEQERMPSPRWRRLGVERTDSWRVTSGRWQMWDQVPPLIQERSQPLYSQRRELWKSLALKKGFLWARFLDMSINLLLAAKYAGIMNSSSYLGKSLSRNPFSLKKKTINPSGSGCTYFGDDVWNTGSRNVWCWDVRRASSKLHSIIGDGSWLTCMELLKWLNVLLGGKRDVRMPPNNWRKKSQHRTSILYRVETWTKRNWVAFSFPLLAKDYCVCRFCFPFPIFIFKQAVTC